MRHRTIQQEYDLAYTMLLGYDCSIVESPYACIIAKIAKGDKTIWFVCPTQESAQALFDKATEIVKKHWGEKA